MPKGSQNDAKMDAKIDENSMRFRNLRFLCFCREYNVKIVFLHEQGYQKSTKIHHCERRALTAAPLGKPANQD